MLSLDSVISTFSPPIVAKIEELQKDGSPFLRKLQSFTESVMIDFSKSASLYDYMVQTIMNNTEDTPELQDVASAIFYCLGCRSNDVKCFSIRLTPYILYSYLRGGYENNNLLSIKICLAKILSMEKQSSSKKSQEPSMAFPSIYHTLSQDPNPNLTPNNLDQYQRVVDTSREPVPSKLKGVPDTYTSYILACISIQRRYLPHILSDKDILLQQYLVLLNFKEPKNVFPPISVVTPLPDRTLVEISEALKAIRCIFGDTPLLLACKKALLDVASASNNETVLLISLLMCAVC